MAKGESKNEFQLEYSRWDARLWRFFLMPLAPLLTACLAGFFFFVVSTKSNERFAGLDQSVNNLDTKIRDLESSVYRLRTAGAGGAVNKGVTEDVKRQFDNRKNGGSGAPNDTGVSKSIETLKNSVTGLSTKITELEKKVGSGNFASASSEVKKQDLDKLQARVNKVEEDVKKRTVIGSSNPDLNKAIEKLHKDLEDCKKTYLPIEVKAKLEGQIKQKEKERAEAVKQSKFKDSLISSRESELKVAEKQKAKTENELRTTAQKLKVAQSKLEQIPQAKEGGVLVLGLHSSNLSLHRYGSLIGEVLEPLKHDYHPRHRVGYGFQEGNAKFTSIIPLNEPYPDDAIARFGKISKAVDGTVDNLDGTYEKIRDEFKTVKGTKECIILASTFCKPPDKTEREKWTDIIPHVILIGSDVRYREMDRSVYLEWQAFCRQGNGWLVVISSEKKAEDLDDKLKSQLRSNLGKLLQPEMKVKR